MVLKRKRSESELSFSSSSTFCSPPRPDQFAVMMDMDGTSVSPLRLYSRNATPAHLPSRTMKRFRDSRPSDEEVHQRTLNMLYSAQKQQQHHSHHLGLGLDQHQSQPLGAQSQSQASQASLHSFWKIPAKSAAALATTAVSVPVPSPLDHPANCEDCGLALSEGRGGDDDSMDVDGFGADAETGCTTCGKHVCSHCSITHLGEQRQCLICAGKKVWVGGLGWTGVSGLKVC
ncbi:hypothetical protein GGR52DRAFT_534166 [Hypoxylon sp. FL1284]|nr:hypothetical protein GGR52DRAFT_534166 [Hypoxylon sp. FL1284]